MHDWSLAVGVTHEPSGSVGYAYGSDSDSSKIGYIAVLEFLGPGLRCIFRNSGSRWYHQAGFAQLLLEMTGVDAQGMIEGLVDAMVLRGRSHCRHRHFHFNKASLAGTIFAPGSPSGRREGYVSARFIGDVPDHASRPYGTTCLLRVSVKGSGCCR
jgi:hypothetical protein